MIFLDYKTGPKLKSFCLYLVILSFFILIKGEKSIASTKDTQVLSVNNKIVCLERVKIKDSMYKLVVMICIIGVNSYIQFLHAHSIRIGNVT